ncbi:hypothetical protein TD95_003134, partial [Thielaviopsis punctulata]
MSTPLRAAKPNLEAAAAFAGGSDPFTVASPTARRHRGQDLDDRHNSSDDTFADDASLDGDASDGTPLRTQRQRYGIFDTHAFGLGPGSSPGQAKRALEAHLVETNRRLDETGRLGHQLVRQRQEVLDQLKLVGDLATDQELPSELRAKLNDIEKEYNDVVKETARAFVPRQRVPSNESGANPTSTSPFVTEARGRRPASPSKLDSITAGSPTKLNIPTTATMTTVASNRRLRNQPTNRVKDIEFAADISTSLLQQVRSLQTLLSEREVELRDTQASNTKLEAELESFKQRFRTYDENESRFREENWNLETKLFDSKNREKESNARAEKLNQSLAVLQSEKNSIQRELDELKAVHAKTIEKHATVVKAHDIELGTAKRSIATAEIEHATMQRKVEDLTRQNSELVRAVSTTRGRTLERESDKSSSEDEYEAARVSPTPEHSPPPPSPAKNTLRHSMLESETIKASLMHAQRTIQSQRTQLHREKTEKLEMRRVLQELRDELEKLREENTSPVTSRRNTTTRRPDPRDMRKPSNRLLGNHRASREEIYVDENDWEDDSDDDNSSSSNGRTITLHPDTAAIGGRLSPMRRLFGTPSPNPPLNRNGAVTPTTPTTPVTPNTESGMTDDSSDAFETANERDTATETDDFQTGAEEISDENDDSGASTETEGPARNLANRHRPRSILARSRNSFHSTASTSAEEDNSHLRTPAAQVSRLRKRRSSHRSRGNSREPPSFMGSPLSYGTNSVTGTPMQGNNYNGGSMSLFAELQDMNSDYDSSFLDTPNRTLGTGTPNSPFQPYSPPPPVPQLPFDPLRDPLRGSHVLAIPNTIRRMMVDSGVNTDFVSDDEDAPVFTIIPVQAMIDDSPVALMKEAMPDFSMVHIEQRSDSPVWYVPPPAPTLSMSLVGAKLASEPVSVPKPEIPALVVSEIFEDVDEPINVPKKEMPILAVSAVVEDADEPVKVAKKQMPTLTVSEVSHNSNGPVKVLKKALPILAVSSFAEHVHEPIKVAKKPLPSLSVSSLQHELHEPVAHPKVEKAVLTVSGVTSAHEIVPMTLPKVPLPTLALSTSVFAHNLSPVAVAKKDLPLLVVSSMAVEHHEPTTVAPVALPILSVSGLEAVADEPMALIKPALPKLAISCAESASEEPVGIIKAPRVLSVSDIHAKHGEPVMAAKTPMRPLSISGVSETADQPVRIASGFWPMLSMSSLAAQHREPVNTTGATAATLSLSSLESKHEEPVVHERATPAVLSMRNVAFSEDAPVAVPAALAPALGFTAMTNHHAEPVGEQFIQAPTLSFTPATDVITSPKQGRSLAPRPLAMSYTRDASLSPIAQPGPSSPSLTMSNLAETPLAPVPITPGPYSPIGFSAHDLQSIFPAPPPSRSSNLAQLGASDFMAQSMEPLYEKSRPTSLLYSQMAEQSFEPVRRPSPPINSLRMSSASMEITEPVDSAQTPRALGFSGMTTEPVTPKQQSMVSSDGVFTLPDVAADYSPHPIVTQHAVLSRSLAQSDALSPRTEVHAPMRLSMSGFTAIDMGPQPMSPKRAGFVMPHGVENPFAGQTSDDGQRFVSLFNHARSMSSAGNSELVIAEDETRQSVNTSPLPESPESQRPLKEVAGNSTRALARTSNKTMVDSSVQTTVTSDAIDDWMAAQYHQQQQEQRAPSYGSGTDETESMPGRPGRAASSIRQSLDEARRAYERSQVPMPMPPPRAPNHARSTSTTGHQTRPRTPAGSGHASTSRDREGGRHVVRTQPETPSKHTLHSHKSSVSSFTSEIDQRFDMTRDLLGMNTDYSRQADPRMMLAVTEVMIGEFVWKYTRRAGRNGDAHGTRRRRFFWIHPYMRMLYWCDENPMLSRKGEVLCKGSRIEAVRVATDDNPMPPGLHRKSMILITAGGAIKFTCQTGQRHETWFNALSYLLHRNEINGTYEPNEMAGNIARADLSEFNPAWRVGPEEEPHLAAYSTDPATARLASRNPHGLLPPTEDNAPTLVGKDKEGPARGLARKRSYQALSTRIGGVFTGTLSSLRSRSSVGNMQASSVYRKKSFMSSTTGVEGGGLVAHDSAEDLRQMIEQQDREADRLENVRACCDGKHDVGTLAHGRNRGLSGHHGHGHGHSHGNGHHFGS